MKPGQESQTAVFVCMGRAFAHGRTAVTKFSDPTAMALLPETARVRVERARTDVPPNGWRERVGRAMLDWRSRMMVVRTVAIDEVVREARSPQLVILGAGLDGRAWRLPELRDVAVFEVDHPDSQRTKKERSAALSPVARDIRFVPVDFTRDSLDEALAKAGHDASRPTTWIWEGVVMYLAREAIEATLSVIENRSAARGRLVLAYHSPSPTLILVRPIVRRVGEPLRSAFHPEELHALLGRHGFTVVRDERLSAIARTMSADAGRPTRVLSHLRVCTADRKDGTGPA